MNGLSVSTVEPVWVVSYWSGQIHFGKITALDQAYVTPSVLIGME